MKLRVFSRKGRRVVAQFRRQHAKPYTLVLHMKDSPVGEIKPRKRTTHLFGVVPINTGLPITTEPVMQVEFEFALGGKPASTAA